MNEQARRFADNSSKAARETIERNVAAAEEAAKVAEQNFSWSLGGLRELNGKLMYMAHANADAVFDLAHEVAAGAPPGPPEPGVTHATKHHFPRYLMSATGNRHKPPATGQALRKQQ